MPHLPSMLALTPLFPFPYSHSMPPASHEQRPSALPMPRPAPCLNFPTIPRLEQTCHSPSFGFLLPMPNLTQWSGTDRQEQTDRQVNAHDSNAQEPLVNFLPRSRCPSIFPAHGCLGGGLFPTPGEFLASGLGFHFPPHCFHFVVPPLHCISYETPPLGLPRLVLTCYCAFVIPPQFKFVPIPPPPSLMPSHLLFIVYLPSPPRMGLDSLHTLPHSPSHSTQLPHLTLPPTPFYLGTVLCVAFPFIPTHTFPLFLPFASLHAQLIVLGVDSFPFSSCTPYHCPNPLTLPTLLTQGDRLIFGTDRNRPTPISIVPTSHVYPPPCHHCYFLLPVPCPELCVCALLPACPKSG